MDIKCETPLFHIYPSGLEFALTVQTGAGRLEARGTVTSVFRAFDGRIGVEFRQPCTDGFMKLTLLPIDNILGYRALQEHSGIEREGDGAAFRKLYSDEIETLLNGPFLGSEGETVPWEHLVEEERLSRLVPSWPQWHKNDEMVIYLTLAASTKDEAPADLATRVGGALRASIRHSNPKRVKLARGLVGLSVGDARFVHAARAIDPHNVARVAASAMFVGLGGEAGTKETMRLLTLLQSSLQAPRFL